MTKQSASERRWTAEDVAELLAEAVRKGIDLDSFDPNTTTIGELERCVRQKQ